jgi:twitching motility two-component system response regulator PilH
MLDMVKRKKVLVVEDSVTDLANLEGILTAEGCTVVVARSGKEALPLAKSEQPEIIFMDIVMDEMDGYEATRRLAQEPSTKHIPVVFVSSKKQKADRVWALMQGGKELISKPYSREQIVAMLNH